MQKCEESTNLFIFITSFVTRSTITSFKLLFIYILCCWIAKSYIYNEHLSYSCKQIIGKTRVWSHSILCHPKSPEQFGTSKVQENMVTFICPRTYHLGGACSLKKTSIDWMKKVIITSSSSLPSLRVGGIPGCLAINSSIKLWVAWSLYKHTKGNSYDSQCSELYRENLLLLRHTEH